MRRDALKFISYVAVYIFESWLSRRLFFIIRTPFETNPFRHYSQVRQLMLASDSVHSIVLQLLDVLIQGFSERNDSIRLKCAECVGELGAVDPGHRPNKIIKSDLLRGTLLDIKSPDFVLQALTILCSGFQSARHSRTIDAFALAIQNVLSVYSVSPQSDMWARFPEHT